MQDTARTIPATTADKPEGWSEWDIWDQMGWLVDHSLLSSVTIYRVRDDNQRESLENTKQPVDLEYIRTRYGTGAFQLEIQRIGVRGCHARSQTFYIGPGPRSQAIHHSPANQPNYAVPQAIAAPQSQDIKAVVAEAVAAALATVQAPKSTDTVSRDEMQRMLREANEASEKRAAEAAEKARQQAKIESLERQVAEAKNAPAKALESDPGIVTTLIKELVALKTDGAKAAQLPPSMTDPMEGLRKLKELSTELGLNAPRGAGSAVAEVVKEVSKSLGPAAEAVAAAMVGNQKAAIDMQGQIKLMELNMQAQAQAAELNERIEAKRHKRALELERLRLYGVSEFPETAAPEAEPELLKPVTVPTPAASSTPTPSQEASPMAAPPLRTFVGALIDGADKDSDRPEGSRLGVDKIVDAAFTELVRKHGQDGIDTVADDFAPFVQADLADPVTQEALVSLVIGSMTLLRRPSAKSALNKPAVRAEVLRVVEAVRTFFAAVSNGDEIAMARMENVLTAGGVA